MLPRARNTYLEAAEEIHGRAVRERNPQAKELLFDIERSFRRLVEMERWSQYYQDRKYDRPFVSFGFFRGG
jgi:hypothetical protein